MSIRRSDDNDVTVFPTGPAAPEFAPFGESALLPATMVHEFRILKLIGEGGFGIVYLAHDESLDRTVALKEYMPSQLAERHGDTLSVHVRSQRHAEPFAAGLRSFMNEARLLARFDHPSLLKVYRFFQANDTAYMAMPFYEGQTLKAVLRAMSGPPDEAWLKRLLYQLLDALEIIHSYEFYHRDISPDNILMLQNDTPLLLDFGAARRVIGDMTRTLTVILKPGYAPIEQYAEDRDMKQGPWTDIYALASVVYFALTREAPVAAIARAMNDRLVPLSQRIRGAYSDEFLKTVDAALSLKPQDRPQNVAELRAMLLAGDKGGGVHVAANAPMAPILAIERLTPTIETTAGLATQPRVATGPSSFPSTSSSGADDAPIAPAAVTAERAAEGGGSTKRLALAGLGMAVPVALAAVWWVTRDTAELAVKVPSAPEIAIVPAAKPEPVPVPPLQATERAPASPPMSAPVQPPATASVAPKSKPPPTKVAERQPEPAKAKAAEPPKVPTAVETKSAPLAPPARVEPVPPPVDVRAAPQSIQRSEDVAEPAAKPPAQVTRVEPKAEPTPPSSKSDPRIEKAPLEIARVEPKLPAPVAQKSALLGRYTGRLMNSGVPVGVTLVISSVDQGYVSGTLRHTGGACADEYRMTGTLRDETLRMRSTHKGGAAGDCTFGFSVSVRGTTLVGATGAGVPIELSR